MAGIEKLHGFQRLVNLEVLDASHNKLTFISGLEANFRLKRFYLNVRAPIHLPQSEHERLRPVIALVP